MAWNNLENPWQIAVSLAWESFKSGSLPIAAVICDMDGNVVSTGRNAMLEESEINRKMAHAEMKALMALDYNAHPRIREYTLYTTLEPCPMCMGSIVMCDLRKVRIAARDPWAGAADMCELPYIANKNISISFEEACFSKILMVLYLYRLLEGYGVSHAEFLKVHKAHFVIEFALAERLLSKNTLRDFADDGAKAEEIYNYIEENLKT